MYNEQTNFSIKNVILQFLFVALFIFILIWLFPLKSDLTKAVNNADNNVNVDLSALTDRIFNENIIAMKDAAKSYYTTPRLPKNVGDKVKMTLREMLDKKIILPFTDKNGDACDTEASYVEITKYDEEFIMKVNLKCGKEENYLLVYMGCYDYCQTALCEKNASDVKNPVIYYGKGATAKATATVVVNNTNTNTNTNTVIVNPTPQPTPVNPTCAIKDGKYYDKNGNETTKEEYERQCTSKPEKKYMFEYKKTTEGYYKESDWSDWSTNAVSASSTVSVKVKTVTEKKLTGYNVTREYDYNNPIYGTKQIQIGTTEKKVCKKYDYVPTGEYSVTYGDWTYVGTEYLSYSPSNSDSVKYIKADESSSICVENCSSSTTTAYKKYVRSAGSKTPVTEYKCVEEGVETTPTYTNIQVITGYNTKITKKEPVYQTVQTKYYSYKTRTYVAGTTDIKWSYLSHDTTLIAAGYKYTGNKKEV